MRDFTGDVRELGPAPTSRRHRWIDGRRWSRLDRAALADRLEALILLLMVRFAVWALPFRTLTPILGGRLDGACPELPGDAAGARRVGAAVRAVARRLPLRCACLERSLAARLMLRRRGVPTCLVFGVHLRDGALAAHAWLQAPGGIVVGGRGHRGCQVVARFLSPPDAWGP